MRQQQRIVSRCNLVLEIRSRYKIAFHFVPINSTRTDNWTTLSHRVILRFDSSKRIVPRCNLELKTRSRYKIVFHYVPINSTRTDSWTLLSHRVILRCDSSKELYRDVICKSKLVLDTKLLSTLFQSIPLELTVELYCHIEWFLDAIASKNCIEM